MSVEDLSSLMEDSLLDSSLSLDPLSKEHPRFSNHSTRYKNAGRRSEEQKKRRETFLLKQKEARHDFQALARSLCKSSTDGETLPEEEEAERSMETEKQEENPFSRSHGRHRQLYKNTLMLSEWLVDIPMDFSEKWLAVPCPMGKRNLVVAGKGKTRFYSRGGSYLGAFPSNLPQGKRAQGSGGSSPMKKHALTLLDCVYHEATEVFYVLDVIIWEGMPFNECDTQLRSFWMRSKLQELEVSNKSKYNPHPFLPLPFLSCGELQTHLAKPLSEHFHQDNVPLDGMLFYHAEAFYVPGPTPLVGWLKGYMIPELIPELDIHTDYFRDKPVGYDSMKAYIDDYQSNSGKKDKKKIFTFNKEMPSPKGLSQKEERVRELLTQNEVISMEKAMEFWTLG